MLYQCSISACTSYYYVGVQTANGSWHLYMYDEMHL